jgi:hypothetical protein
MRNTTLNRFIPSLGAALAVGAIIGVSGAQNQPPANTESPAPPAAQEPADRATVPPVESPTQFVPRPSAWGDKLTFEVRPRFEYAFESSLDDSPTDVSVTRTGLIVDLGFPVSDRLKLSLNTDFEASWYSFDSGSSAGLFADPFNDVYRFRVAPGFFYAINQQWGILAGGIVELAGESDADVSDSATYGGYVGARYAFNEDFALTAGFQAKTRIEDNALFLPILGFEWRVTPRVTLATSGPGIGLRLTAMLDEEWSFSIGTSWEPRDYRLSDDAPIPDGIARDERMPVIAGFTWKPTPGMSFNLYGGAIVWQELTLDDADGNEIAQDNTDPTGFVGFTAAFRF